MTDSEIAAHLADSLETLVLETTNGYNTMPKSLGKRMAIENALETLAAYRANKLQSDDDYVPNKYSCKMSYADWRKLNR